MMKENFGYLIAAYALIGGLITVYMASLMRRSGQVVRELERLAATMRQSRKGTEKEATTTETPSVEG
jgi:CcmD family protein